MGPSRGFTLMYMLLHSAADLHHWGEDDRDLHPLLGAGSLRCHTCHQGFGWVLPEQRQAGRRGLGHEMRSSGEVGLPGSWGHGKAGLHRRWGHGRAGLPRRRGHGEARLPGRWVPGEAGLLGGRTMGGQGYPGGEAMGRRGYPGGEAMGGQGYPGGGALGRRDPGKE